MAVKVQYEGHEYLVELPAYPGDTGRVFKKHPQGWKKLWPDAGTLEIYDENLNLIHRSPALLYGRAKSWLEEEVRAVMDLAKRA